jgi:hypothetical protein
LPSFRSEDVAIAEQLKNALEQVAMLPLPDQWRMALELLSDDFFFYILRVRDRQNEFDQMNLYGLLGLIAIDALLENEEIELTTEMRTRLLSIGLVGIMVSCLGELERRHKQFCDSVEIPEMPFLLNEHEPVKYFPRDPENFHPDLVMNYYVERARAVA